MNGSAGDGPPHPTGPPDDDAAMAPGQRLLMVDDHPDFVHALAMLLRSRGFEVHVAPDGPSALALARDLAPDVVLLDIGLPGMDGYEVARMLRDHGGPTPRLLVAMSGYDPDEGRRQALALGFDHYLVKPIDLNELLGLLGAA